MSDERISTNDAIDAALRFDGDPQKVKQFYADWAENYNRDTGDSNYSGPGGLLLISTRSHYYDQTDPQGQVDSLLHGDRLIQLQTIWNAPYNHDGDAHYWLFRKPPEPAATSHVG